MNDTHNTALLSEARLFKETGPEARIAALVEGALEGLGFRLVRVRLSGLNGCTLQIMAERVDGTLSIEECEAISLMLSPLLDVEDFIDSQYNLEISSPGIDRPLMRYSDFQRAQQHLIKVELALPMHGKRKLRGLLMEATEAGFMLKPETPAREAAEETTEEAPAPLFLTYEQVKQAHLIVTDALIREVLAKEKMAKKKQQQALKKSLAAHKSPASPKAKNKLRNG